MLLFIFPSSFFFKYLYYFLQELHKQRFIVIQKKKGECRNHDREIMAARRELLPLTTGLVVRVKKERAAMLRERVRKRRRATIRIQALWRRAIVRTAHADPYRDYWIECYDEEQGEGNFYYNTWSQETVWKPPLSFKYFGKHYNEEPVKRKRDQEDEVTAEAMQDRDENTGEGGDEAAEDSLLAMIEEKNIKKKTEFVPEGDETGVKANVAAVVPAAVVIVPDTATVIEATAAGGGGVATALSEPAVEAQQ